MTAQIILASASPRRRELLDQIKIVYRVHPVDVDETPLLNEAPLDYVQRLAAEKSAVCVAAAGRQLAGFGGRYRRGFGRLDYGKTQRPG